MIQTKCFFNQVTISDVNWTLSLEIGQWFEHRWKSDVNENFASERRRDKKNLEIKASGTVRIFGTVAHSFWLWDNFYQKSIDL
jgi:hypothetical protein